MIKSTKLRRPALVSSIFKAVQHHLENREFSPEELEAELVFSQQTEVPTDEALVRRIKNDTVSHSFATVQGWIFDTMNEQQGMADKETVFAKLEEIVKHLQNVNDPSHKVRNTIALESAESLQKELQGIEVFLH